jgi:catechol 2,3-dioxygenase-like lactoylglutathione lyase family enzyme
VTLTTANHVGFAVSDLEVSIPSYTALLEREPYFDEVYEGIEYIGRATGYPGAAQRAAFFNLPGQGEFFLELIQYLEPKPESVRMDAYLAGNAHLCLGCDDLSAEYERIRLIPGISFRSDGPVSSDYGVFSGARGLFARDPDDITIQFVEIPPGVDPGGKS